ncbi:MAG TPA: flagellar type III secretion system pore protein FliP [Candidatus Hydrogenedentes bacterium]|nr:flagellar type III secretion system pore protein FliP [Candidatus Hydrogenedentota bacterium]
MIPVARLGIVAALLLIAAPLALAQDPPPDNSLGLNIFQTARESVEPQQLSTTLTVFLLLTVLTLAPAILVMTTSFTRIIVVLGFLRQAMATQQTPPNQVLIGLALFLTYFIMAPTYQRVYDESLQPYIANEISAEEALTLGLQPVRDFMFRQVLQHPKDLALFINIAKLPRPNSPDDVPTHVLICAFILNEMRIAFMIGFIIYIPFLIIDMVVASTLMAMGMMMLPPVFISLPFKIILFVLADGWFLIVSELVNSFG